MVSRGLDRRWLVALLALSLGACTDDAAPAPPPTIHIAPSQLTTNAVDFESLAINGDDPQVDPCELASALPADDMCSLICDPDALIARMLDSGMHHSTCYHLRCTLSDEMTVNVGVCLP